jgi:hypothetical protein
VDVREGQPVSVPHSLFKIKDAVFADVANNYDVRPDGKQFLIYQAPREEQDTPITVVLNWWARLRQQP